MPLSIPKVGFAAPFYPTDKIIYESPLQSRSVAAGSAVAATVDNFSVSHPKGRETIVEGVFSIDGTNFYPFGSTFYGAFGVDMFPQWCLMNAYNNANTIFFRIQNGFDAGINFRYYYWLESIA